MWGIITGIASFIWGGIQAGFDAIVVALQWAANALKTGLLGAWSAVRFAWSDIIRPIGQAVDWAYDRLKTLYTAVIQPALAWLKRITAVVRSVYNTLLRPILNTIDHVRQVLQLLELLHVSFAAKLDAELADLERKLSLPLQLVIQVLNGISNRIESYVLTAENLFQRVTHLGSIGRDVQAIQNIHWGQWVSGLTDAQRATPATPGALAPVDDHVALLQSALTDDTVGDGIDIAGAVALLQTTLAS